MNTMTAQKMRLGSKSDFKSYINDLEFIVAATWREYNEIVPDFELLSPKEAVIASLIASAKKLIALIQNNYGIHKWDSSTYVVFNNESTAAIKVIVVVADWTLRR